MHVAESAKYLASCADNWMPYPDATSRHVESSVGLVDTRDRLTVGKAILCVGITVATHVGLGMPEFGEEVRSVIV